MTCRLHIISFCLHVKGKKMKVLLVSAKTDNSKGGIASWTELFLRQCKDVDIDCDLLNIATVGKRALQGNAKRNLKDEIVRTKNIFLHLKSLLKSNAYEVAHINTSLALFGIIRDYLIAVKIKRLQPDVKMILQFHCDITHQMNNKVKWIVLKKLLLLIDNALVLNTKSQIWLRENLNIDSIVVANFVEDSFVRTDEKEIRDSIEKAIFVGYVQPQKGVKEIFELADRFPDITFELIGEVREDVSKWEKPENIKMLGPMIRERIKVHLDDSDLFIFPTHSEGFSLALLESMARGVPCVVTDAGANREMVEDAKGSVLSVGDIEGMTNAIYQLKSSNKRREISCRLIEKVKEEYIVASVIEKIYYVYIGKM